MIWRDREPRVPHPSEQVDAAAMAPRAHPGVELRSVTARAIGFLAHAMRDATDHERRTRDDIESALAEAVGPFVTNVAAQPVLPTPGLLRVGGFFQLVDEAINAAATAVWLGGRTGVAARDLRRLAQAMLLRDVGMVALAPGVRQTSGPLTRDGWDLMHQHAAHAAAVLDILDWGDGLMRQIVRHHHARAAAVAHAAQDARLDCAPADFAHLVAIAAVADVFTALTSPRPHRRLPSASDVAGELRRAAGISLGRDVVKCLLAAWRPLGATVRQGAGSRPDRAVPTQALGRSASSRTVNRSERPTQRFAWADRRL